MGELINGRTPEEIKRVLEWANCACGNMVCEECQYYESVCCHENFERIAPDALALIQHLESERDAAIEALKITKHCSVCKWHYSNEGICIGAGECGRQKGLIGMRPEWEWAGAPKPPKEV